MLVLQQMIGPTKAASIRAEAVHGVSVLLSVAYPIPQRLFIAIYTQSKLQMFAMHLKNSTRGVAQPALKGLNPDTSPPPTSNISFSCVSFLDMSLISSPPL